MRLELYPRAGIVAFRGKRWKMVEVRALTKAEGSWIVFWKDYYPYDPHYLNQTWDSVCEALEGHELVLSGLIKKNLGYDNPKFPLKTQFTGCLISQMRREPQVEQCPSCFGHETTCNTCYGIGVVYHD